MYILWFVLVSCWITILVFPEIIAYIIGILLLWIWANIIITRFFLDKKTKSKADYVSFGKYKIYKD